MKPEKECMLHQRKLVSFIVSLTLPLSDGLENVKSVILKLVEVSIGTGSSHRKPQWNTQLKTLLLLVESLSSTQESPRVLNGAINNLLIMVKFDGTIIRVPIPPVN